MKKNEPEISCKYLKYVFEHFNHSSDLRHKGIASPYLRNFARMQLKTDMNMSRRTAVQTAIFPFSIEASIGSAEKAILEGLGQGTLYIALNNDICAGFIWYLAKGAFHSFHYVHITGTASRTL